MVNIKKHTLIISGLIIAILFIVRLSYAVPKTMSYQGKLMDSSGAAQTGFFDFQFAIWDVSSGGTTSIWPAGSVETHAGVEVKDGLYNVELGDIVPIDAKFDKDYWIEVKVRPNGVGSYETLYPRIKLTTSPYAFACPGTMVLLYTNDVDLSGSATQTSVKSYVLSANSYARILAIAEVGIGQSGANACNYRFDLKCSGGPTETINLVHEGSGASDSGTTYTSMSLSPTYSAGGTVSLDVTKIDTNGTWYIKSFRVYGIY